MHNIEDLLFRFKEHLKVLNRSTATISTYVDHVKGFLATLECQDIKAVTRAMIEAYIAGLYDYKTEAGKPYTVNTICLKIRALKRFFEFLERANIIFMDPTETLREPKRKRTLVKEVLTDEEAEQLLNQPDQKTPLGIRDRAVLEVFYSTGIRLEELTSLSLHDVDLTERLVRVNKGKGAKDRVIPMGKHTVRFLREYITRTRPHLTRRNRTIRNLFVDIHGRPLSKQAASIMIKRYGRASGIKRPVTAHTFRHTFATALIRNGADIRAVQEMLGHSDLKTTQTYIRSLGLDIKKVHEKTHPRERDKEEDHAPDIKRILPEDGSK